MTDLISRADAIEAVFAVSRRVPTMAIRAKDALESLPSAELVLQTPQTYGKSINPSNAEVVEDYISRADALRELNGVCSNWEDDAKVAEIIHALPSAEGGDAETNPIPTGTGVMIQSPNNGAEMTEKVREALMRLTMCAREECGMCKYKDECGFDFQYKISTENMNTLLDALSAETLQGWIPCSERLPEVHPYKDVTGMTWDESDDVLICMNYGNMHVATYEVDSEARRYWVDKDGLEYTGVIAWMPLPKPYEGSESDETD